MEKRFLAFLAISFAIVMANALVVQRLWPPQRGPARIVADRDQGPDQGLDPAATDAGPEAEPAAEDETGADRPPPAPSAPEDKGAQVLPEEAAPRANFPERRLALGSLDPKDGYRMLVVLTSRGAAIERLALSSHRYTSLEDRSGYLGPLALEDVPAGGGCRVRVVGRGTPAAAAGLQPGDIIRAVRSAGGGTETIGTAADLVRFLSGTKPSQVVSLVFVRDGKQMPDVPVPLRRRPLEVMRPERENLLDRETPVPAGLDDPPSLLLTPNEINDQTLGDDQLEFADVDLREGNWEIVEQKADSVAFRRVLPAAQIEFIKRYRLERVPEESLADPTYPGYGLTVEIEIRNIGSSPQRVAYRLDGPTGLPVEGWWYANKIGRSWGGVGLRDVVLRFEGAAPELIGCASIVGNDVEPRGQGSALAYVGVDAQYFAAVLIPEKEQPGQIWFEETRAIGVGTVQGPPENKRLANVTFRLVSEPVTLAPGAAPLRHRFTLFAGPKMPGLLAHYGQQQDLAGCNLQDLVYYGWFGWVAKPMLAILHAFYFVVRNYGIAIILLTVLVRGGMFPLSVKQTRNMQKMQELQPEIKRIAEKYKKDMEKRTKAQQELFRAHRYNPMGGCLVMFLQLPVFLGLYRSLMVDVELRQAPLLGDAIRWCSNLSAPDMLWDWSAVMPEMVNNGVGVFGLGPYLNVLPLVTVGLFVVQQKMFMPPPADEQAAMQQKVMKYMMIFMGLLFFKVASGLCIYFIASSLWGLAERKLLPKGATPADGQPPQLTAKPPPSGDQSNGRQQFMGKTKRPRQRR